MCRRHDRHRSEQVTLLYKAIGMSIDSLTEELKKYYQDMALFMNDVNIKPEVNFNVFGVFLLMLFIITLFVEVQNELDIRIFFAGALYIVESK